MDDKKQPLKRNETQNEEKRTTRLRQPGSECTRFSFLFLFLLENIKILDQDPNWFERAGIKITIKNDQPPKF